MRVMGKDWCGECAWPERANYTFQHGKTVYSIDVLLSEKTDDLTRWNRSGLERAMPTQTKPVLQFDEADALFSKRGGK